MMQAELVTQSTQNANIPLIRPSDSMLTEQAAQPMPALAGKITEIVMHNNDFDQLTMLLPLLAQLSRDDRWFAWIAPPSSLPKALLSAAGIDLNKIMLLQPDASHTTYDLACQALQAGTCHAVITWPGMLSNEQLNGLENAAEHGASHGIVIRDRMAS
ncbi:cell division inhibitor SulA [Aliamphritea spongicola]|uniref:cell division inhibitor SulA n=1 Tax=Aliamphritea spongicola TaxID=707589 RepID=UPI001FAF7240|nr:SulA-like leucine-rich domain-containing protein [Aliamphritea spongicola]